MQPSEMDRGEIRIRARWVFPVDHPPLENATVVIQESLVTTVSTRQLPNTTDLGNVALIPGLINAHTHLEFSLCSDPIAPCSPFPDWIRSVIKLRRENHPLVKDALQLGIRESIASGVVALGETATTEAENYPDHSIDVVLFKEVIGLRASEIPDRLELVRRWLDQADRSVASGGLQPPDSFNDETQAEPVAPNSLPRPTRCGDYAAAKQHRRGISLHSPYTLHPQLCREVIKLARERRAPVSMHLAETHEELELLEFGRGILVDRFREMGFWDETAIPLGTRPLDYLRMLAELPRGQCVHGNYLGEEDLSFLRDNSQISVIYCPRTHAYFGHPPHPFERLVSQGIPVALGTDGRSSNPDLSIWSEALYLRKHRPNLPLKMLLEMVTIQGARALMLESELGTITPGKRASLTIVPLESTPGEPHDLLFRSRSPHNFIPFY